MGFVDSTGLSRIWQNIKTALSSKQNKITGTSGQVVMFDSTNTPVGQTPSWLPLTGGTLTGNLTLKNNTNYGCKINLGDSDFVHISEPSDDCMEIKAKKINFVVSDTSTSRFTLNGAEISTTGPKGETGTRGSLIYTGTAITGTTTTNKVFSSSGITDALVNDTYINTSTGYVYQCTTAGAASVATWVYKGSIKGATGSTGTAAGFGTPTATVDANVGTPSVSVTTSGTNTSKVFSFAFSNLKGATGNTGATGTRGSQINYGTTITGTSTTATTFSSSGITSALVNDMYINTSTWNVYQCTTAGAASTAKWKYVGNIKGATGNTGATGSTGTAAGFGTPTATVDANVGTPSVTVTASGANTAKVFSFAFSNLKGATGNTGATGPQGTRGSLIYTGTTITGTSTTATTFSSSGITSALVNDMYINTSTGYMYQCSTGGAASVAKWVYKGSIKGATGSTGTAAGFGTPTATVDNSVGTPSVTVTSSGTNTSKVFSFAFSNLKGATGATGSAGPGLATGGTLHQVPWKKSTTNYDTEWHTLTASDVSAVPTAGGTMTGALTIGKMKISWNSSSNSLDFEVV